MTEHDFCRQLEVATRLDLDLARDAFSVVTVTGGIHCVQGPRDFYWESSACCKWAARSEAYDVYCERETP